MKIFIHGRKDGYNVLYPKPTPTEFFQFASDIQRIDAENNARHYGKSLYSIAFNGSGCIFSKFLIGYDNLRGNLGNIGVSVFVPSNQKMAGTDVKTLLDELVNIYRVNYCPDWIINDNKQEDWLLFTSCADRYDAKLRTVPADDVENYQQGAKDPAFVLYASDAEIQKYFDNPYQDEYKDYKQILLLENNARDLLNVIKHDANANLTGKIDLTRTEYKLREFHGQGKDGISIEIRANGKRRSNKDKITNKDSIEIVYSKSKYFHDIKEQGKLADDNIKKYLIVDEENRKIDVKKDIDLPPVEKIINLIITDRNRNPVSGVEISCKNAYSNATKSVINNTINFKGEELKEYWTFSARKNENFYSKEVSVIPENQIGDVTLILEEYKKIEITVHKEKEDGEILYETDGVTINKTEFIGDEIEKIHKITVSCKGFENYSFDYCPAKDKKSIHIALKRYSINGKRYLIDAGKYGTASAGYSQREDGSDVTITVKTKGYKFDSFKLDKNKKTEGYEGTLIVQYKKKTPFYKNPKFIAGSAVAILILVVVIWALCHLFGKEKPQETPLKDQIQMYVEGDSLFSDKLTALKNNWEKQKPEIKKEGGSWLSVFRIGGKEEKTDSTTFNQWSETAQNIGRAIEKRNLIDGKNFAELKNQRYSTAQQKFKNVINDIDSTKYAKFADIDFSALTLIEIADSINAILMQKGNVPEKPVEKTPKPNQEDTKAEVKKEPAASTPSKQPEQRVTSSAQTQNLPVTNNSTNLEREFFDLIQSGSNQMDAYKKIYDKYKKDSTNEIVVFLKGITKSSKDFTNNFKSKFDKIPAMDKQKIKNLTQLKDKLQ